MRRLLAPTVLLTTLAGCGWWSTPAPEPDAEPPAEPAPPPLPSLPDLVVITLDTTRADHLGLYGYPRDTSPRLDAFAASALVFDRLIVPMATTLPTHTSLFTAVWPLEHGVTSNIEHGGERFVPSPALTPFAAWARERGYDTAGFVSAAVLRGETGISSGFDTFDVPRRHERRADRTIDKALAWLAAHDARSDARPALLWVHLFDPHNPYAPPPHLRQAFQANDPAIDAWIAARDHAETGTRPTGEVVHTRLAINLYDAEIAYMDGEVGRLLDALQARPSWSQTAVVIAGDHGEGLNQHGEPGHGLVWEEQLHAPLLMRIPSERPRRVPVTLSMADVLPTLLGLVTLPEASTFLDQASGTDVLTTGFAERPVLSMRSTRQTALGKDMVWTLTGPRDKCRLDASGANALYDLDVDPFERWPIEDAPERLEACVQALTAERDRQIARGQQLGAGRTEPMTAEEVEALEALGYVEGAP